MTEPTAWRKSSYSGDQGACVEVGPAPAHIAWHKSTHSGDQGDCVEVGPAPAHIGIRDTKNRDQGHLTVPRTAWRHFIQHVTR